MNFKINFKVQVIKSNEKQSGWLYIIDQRIWLTKLNLDTRIN